MITDYATLVATVQAYIKSPEIDAQTDLFIQQTEADLDRELRHPYMEAESPVTLAGNTIMLPTGFLQLRDINVQLPNGIYSLEQATPEYFNRVSPMDPGQPSYFYSLQNGEYKVHPSVAGSELTLLYYEKIPALSVSNTTNWVITNYPMLYWYGCIHYVWQWKMADGMEEKYGQAFGNHVQQVKKEGMKRRHGGQGIAVHGV